jgi:hypothetical protein
MSFRAHNGQVERVNTEILKGLKTHTYDGLKKHDKRWINEISCALWRNRTSPSQATRETPFFMVYRAEAVLPRKSSCAPYMSRDTMKPRRTSSGVKISISSIREDGNLLSKMYGTAKHSNATKRSSCVAESSRWKIWCSNGCSLKRVLTSSPPARRAPSE